MITEKQLDEWQKMCDKATGGPWTFDDKDFGCHGSGSRPYYCIYGPTKADCTGTPTGIELLPERALSLGSIREWHENGVFVAEARTAIPALFAEVRRLRSALKQIRAVVRNERWMDHALNNIEDILRETLEEKEEGKE